MSASTELLAQYVRVNHNLDDEIKSLRTELAALRADSDELRRVLDQMLIAWGTGELACDVINGRWWPALEDAKKLLEARP